MNWGGTPRRLGSRRLRAAGLGLLAIVAGVAAAVFAVPLAVRGLIGAVTWLFDASVWLALSTTQGASTWSMIGTVGRATAGALVTRQASTVLAVLVLVAAAALYGLQRLLGGAGSEREPEEPSR